MLKTNSKEVKKYFDEYLEDVLECSFDNDIDKMAKQFVASASNSKNELAYNYKTYQEAFETITMNYGECYYSEMREHLQKALQQTEEESLKYSNDEVAHKYNYLLYCAYLRKCEKENVKPYQFKSRY